MFDTELLRYAVGWQDGGLELTGTVYDGKHGPHPWVRGEPVFEDRERCVAQEFPVVGLRSKRVIRRGILEEGIHVIPQQSLADLGDDGEQQVAACGSGDFAPA